MTFICSPGLVEALESAETEAQARNRLTMLHVIQNAAMKRTIARDRTCPWCGSEPPLPAKVCGRFVVECENEDCDVSVSAAGDTPEEAMRRWNARP